MRILIVIIGKEKEDGRKEEKGKERGGELQERKEGKEDGRKEEKGKERGGRIIGEEREKRKWRRNRWSRKDGYEGKRRGK